MCLRFAREIRKETIRFVFALYIVCSDLILVWLFFLSYSCIVISWLLIWFLVQYFFAFCWLFVTLCGWSWFVVRAFLSMSRILCVLFFSLWVKPDSIDIIYFFILFERRSQRNQFLFIDLNVRIFSHNHFPLCRTTDFRSETYQLSFCFFLWWICYAIKGKLRNVLDIHENIKKHFIIVVNDKRFIAPHEKNIGRESQKSISILIHQSAFFPGFMSSTPHTNGFPPTNQHKAKSQLIEIPRDIHLHVSRTIKKRSFTKMYK